MNSDCPCESVGLAGSPELTGFRLGTPSWFGTHQNGDTAIVNINGEIGIGAPVEDLLAVVAAAKWVQLFINTAGGSTVCAFKLLDGLAGRVVQATISEKCFSAGVVVAFAAKKIRIEAGARMMIHPASDFVFGQESELRWRADCLAKINTRQNELLSSRTPRAAEFLSGQDFWFTADEALAAGLVDEILPSGPVAEIQSAANDPTDTPEPAPTSDEILFNEFLRAFGPLRVRSHRNFIRDVNAWACHNAAEA